jgi:1,4-dihydroxy-2-naphthoyl-CoA synthase
MQQAYSAIRVVSEAQTVRIVLSARPGEQMLKELSLACASFGGKGSDGIKAVVLDFARLERSTSEEAMLSQASVERARVAIRAVAQPVLAVVRGTLSPAAIELLAICDLSLVANDVLLAIPTDYKPGQNGKESKDSAEAARSAEPVELETLPGERAAQMGYVTWSAPAGDLSREMERILNMLREKSGVALRLAKASLRIGQAEQEKQESPLEALRRINVLYLSEVMQTQDAHEGLRAFLEKRKPAWKNR